MIILLAWLTFSLVIGFAFANRLTLLAIIAIYTRLSIPYYANDAWVPGLHLAGYFTLTVFLIQLVFYAPRVKRLLLNSKFEILGALFLSGLMLLNSVTQYTSLTRVLINILIVYFPGFILYLLIKMAILKDGYKSVKTMSFAILANMAFQFYIAIQQDITGLRVVYEKYAVGVGWWIKDGTTGSAIGLTESHLEFTSLCAVAIGLTYFIRNFLIQFLAISMLLYSAILATGRASIAMSIAMAILVIAVSQYSVIYKIVNYLILIITATIALTTTGAGERLLSKLEDDGISTELRVEAYKWIALNWKDFILYGFPGNRDFRSAGVLGSSLENAYLMASVEYGLLFGIGYLIFHIVLATKNIRSIHGFVLSASALTIIVANNTHSAYQSNTLSAYLLWISIGLTVGGLFKQESAIIELDDVSEQNTEEEEPNGVI